MLAVTRALLALMVSSVRSRVSLQMESVALPSTRSVPTITPAAACAPQ